MTGFWKGALRSLLPGRFYRPLRAAYRGWRDQRGLERDPRWRESVRRLEAFRDRHAGERCFILGNGPSLKKTDLTRLRGEFTFGLNRIYLLFDDIGFPTTYHVSINDLVIEQCAEEMSRLPCPSFLGWRMRDHLKFGPGMIFLRSLPDRYFVRDVTEGVSEGSTVTFVAMQLAYFMGFREVILLGVDHSFASKGPAHKVVVSHGDDPNHFDPRYFGKGFRWQLPDLDTSELSYRIARHEFEKDGRRILDATLGGKLEVFPKVEYDALFQPGEGRGL